MPKFVALLSGLNEQEAAEVFVEFISLLTPPQVRILKPLVKIVMDYIKYCTLVPLWLTTEPIIKLRFVPDESD